MNLRELEERCRKASESTRVGPCRERSIEWISLHVTKEEAELLSKSKQDLPEAALLLREAWLIIEEFDTPLFKADECGCPDCEKRIEKERLMRRERWKSRIEGIYKRGEII